jgi:predicted molibdopterin-dependent oxidoreductase YjgC
MTNNIPEIEDNDVLLVIGSNTSETHPVIALRMKEAVRKGAQLIVADPRRIQLVNDAKIHLRQKPGSDGALINALCHVILRDGLTDEKFIAERTQRYEEFADSVRECTPEWAEKITGVPAATIESAAHCFAKADKGAVYYTMGITQHTSGTDNVLALANLVMLTGNIGRHGVGLNPLRGQNNVQGASDMGCLPVYYPGYQRVDDAEAQKRFENLWKTKLSSKPGLTATEMSLGMIAGNISGLWIMGENPVLSDPNSNHVCKALQNLEFLVVQDIFLTETAELADVVLPAGSFAEKEGTFTNTERRVQRVRKAVSSPGFAKNDLAIINLLSARMQFGYSGESFQGYDNYMSGRFCGLGSSSVSPEGVFAEMGQAWPALAGINYERLEENGIQWPCPTEDHPGTEILFEGGFLNGRASFTPIVWHGPSETPDEEYPLILTTGRVLYQYHTGTMTRKCPEIEAVDKGAYVQLHPSDAARLSICDGEVVTAISRRGRISLPAMVTDMVETGVVFIPFHYKEAAVNLLTNDALDPVSKIPEAKVCAVRIEKQS